MRIERKRRLFIENRRKMKIPLKKTAFKIKIEASSRKFRFHVAKYSKNSYESIIIAPDELDQIIRFHLSTNDVPTANHNFVSIHRVSRNPYKIHEKYSKID